MLYFIVPQPDPSPPDPPDGGSGSREAPNEEEQHTVQIGLEGTPGAPFSYQVEYLSCGCTEQDSGVFGSSGVVEVSIDRLAEPNDTVRAYFSADPDANNYSWPMDVELRIDGNLVARETIDPSAGVFDTTLEESIS